MIGTAHDARKLATGTSLGRRMHDPLSRMQIAWYMVASYDRNPIHIDEPFAKAAGFPTVIGQGMIPMGWISGRLVEEVGLHRLRGIGADFLGPLFPGVELSTDIELAEVSEKPGGVELRWRISAQAKEGDVKLKGWARTFHEESE